LKKALLIALILALNVGCDQASKTIAKARLEGKGTLFVLGDFIVLRYVENQGAFLGLGSDLPAPIRRAVFIAFPLLFLFYMIVQVVRKKAWDPGLIVACSFIAGGGFGNLIDRLAFDGRVRDFVNVGIGNLRTGVFNAADLSIMIGCLLLAVRAALPPRAQGGRRGPAPDDHPPASTVK
jgi:signal peptidase II